MRRICMILLSIMFVFSTVYAEQISYIEGSQNGNEVCLTISENAGYIKWIRDDTANYDYMSYYSKDGQNWKLITNESNEKALYFLYPNYAYSPKIFEIGEYLICIKCSAQFPLGMHHDRSSKIYIFDKNNFNLIKDISTDNSIGMVSYVDGVFYVLAYTEFYSNKEEDIPYDEYSVAIKQRVFSTTDFENWEIYSEDGTMPITNGRTTIYTRNSLMTPAKETNFNGRKVTKPQKVYTFLNNQVDKEIVYEEISVSQIFPIRDLYVATPATENNQLRGKFLVSKDGVYFTIVDLPIVPQNKHLYDLFMMSDMGSDKLLCTVSSYEMKTYLDYYRCDYHELEQLVKDDNIYVRLNDNILGFSTPPITEDDRTLVPMRFLFEQMGAEVSWDEAAQTATATVPVSQDAQLRTLSTETAKSVTFAIDNTTATVNGATATMDVPARLVNDKTMVPLRFLSENLGYTVEWDEATNTAIITTN